MRPCRHVTCHPAPSPAPTCRASAPSPSRPLVAQQNRIAAFRKLLLCFLFFEPVTTSNHARARLHHSIGTHTRRLHGALKVQGVATGSSNGPSAHVVQELIIQLLLQQPYESRLYLALVLQCAAADSWDVAATLLKTALKMVPDWTEGGVMLGCDRKRSRLPCRAQ